jgi:hypothetical protein
MVAQWHGEGESMPVQDIPFRIVGHTYDHASNTMSFRFEFDARRYADSMRRIDEAMRHLTEQFHGLHYSIDESYFDPPLHIGPVPRPETSRERALRLMRERGHGPDIPLERRLRDL